MLTMKLPDYKNQIDSLDHTLQTLLNELEKDKDKDGKSRIFYEFVKDTAVGCINQAAIEAYEKLKEI